MVLGSITRAYKVLQVLTKETPRGYLTLAGTSVTAIITKDIVTVRDQLLASIDGEKALSHLAVRYTLASMTGILRVSQGRLELQQVHWFALSK